MTLSPEAAGVAGYQTFIEAYQAGLPIESAAIAAIKDEK